MTEQTPDVQPGSQPGTRAAMVAAVAGRHPATVRLVGHFAWAHLPPPLQAISRPIADVALAVAGQLPDGPDLTTGLRKLLEAKDSLVRAALPDA